MLLALQQLKVIDATISGEQQLLPRTSVIALMAPCMSVFFMIMSSDSMQCGHRVEAGQRAGVHSGVCPGLTLKVCRPHIDENHTAEHLHASCLMQCRVDIVYELNSGQVSILAYVLG